MSAETSQPAVKESSTGTTSGSSVPVSPNTSSAPITTKEKSSEELKPLSLRQRVLDAAGKLASTLRGAKALSEWLGQGGVPVEPKLAGSRAIICAGCPHNVDNPNLLGAVALASIQEYEFARNHLRLSVPEDDLLHTCGICSCPLKLKIWVPMEHIKPSTEEFSFPPYCWIPRELAPPEPKALTAPAQLPPAPPTPATYVSQGQVTRIR